MKIAWHIFRKDLRRLALPLLLWGALAVLQFLSYLYFKATSTGSSDDSLGWGAAMFLWGLQLAAAWLLVPVLIQDDSLLSDRAGWRTRPISGGRLLGAKLLGLGLLLCVWPTLLTLPWWLELGFGVGEILRVMAVHALGMIVFLGLAVVVAVLTETIVRFLAWSFVLVFGCGIALFTISAEASYADGGRVAGLLTRAALAFAIVAVGTTTVILLQFLTRRFRLAVALAGVTAAVAGLVAWQWPWSRAELLARTGLARFALPRATGRVNGATLFVPAEGKGGKATLQLTADFACPDIAAGDALEWQELEATLRHGATGRLPLTMRLQPVWRSTDVESEVIRAVAEGRGDVHGPRTFRARGRIDLPAAIVPRLRSGTATLGGDVAGVQWRGERELKVPFRAGESGGGFRTWHLSAVRSQPLPNESSVEWVETAGLFTPEAVLEQLAKGRHLTGKQTSLEVRGGGKIEYLQPGRRSPETRFRVGLLEVEPCSSDDRFSTDGERYGPYQLSRSADATLVGFSARVMAPLATRVAAAPLVPDLVVEGNVDLALRRAQAEGKLLLVMVHGRDDYDATAQIEPYAWTEPKVRELLRTRFVCAQIFGKDDPRFAPHYIESRFAMFVVLAPDGREQDAFPEPWRDDWWLTALTANAQGTTYAGQLRQELARQGGTDRELRQRLSNALLARGDFDEAVSQLLQAAEREPNQSHVSWQTPSGLWGMASRLEMLVRNNESLKAALLQRQATAVADLRRDPRDVMAARRLYIATLAMKDPRAIVEFPRLLPRENPGHWSLLSGWLFGIPPPVTAGLKVDLLDWEDFFREGRGWAQERLAETRHARQEKPEDYINEVNRYRGRVVRVGMTGVRVIAAAGQGERARRLAEEVLQVDSGRWVRSQLAAALQGHVDAKVLHEIDPLGNH